MLDVRNDQRAERERGRSVNNSHCCCSHTASSSGPRCSRNVPSTLLIAPAEPGPEGLPGACQLQLGPETAARTCQRAACGLPAAAALPAAGALSASPVCSGPAAAGASLFGSWSVRQLLGAFGGAGGAARGIGREQKRVWWWRFECRPVLSFDRFFQCHPLSFAAS